MKRVLLLGSTGSIGESALDVISRFPGRFTVTALVAGRNIEKLKAQAERFSPEAVCLVESNERFAFSGKFYSGMSGLKELIDSHDFDICISAISGSAGILPTYWSALKAERLAIANKEAIVSAGMFIMKAPCQVIPVDSEHSAVFQCLKARPGAVEIILTASGGPLRDRHDLESVTPEEALSHPNWRMGAKVTVDSATLMNKGLEVIEAHWLFGFPPDRIKVVVHPQSIVHSLVRFSDNSLIAQLSVPDMRIPISYALGYPDGLPLGEEFELRLPSLELSFEEPDVRRFPCLRLAYGALESGYPSPIVLNSANEVAVNSFLARRIPFTAIPAVIEKTLEKADFPAPSSIEDVVEIDRLSKKLAEEVLRCL